MAEDTDSGQELSITQSASPLDLVIAGGGFAGLAAAIAAAQAGLEYRITLRTSSQKSEAS